MKKKICMFLCFMLFTAFVFSAEKAEGPKSDAKNDGAKQEAKAAAPCDNCCYSYYCCQPRCCKPRCCKPRCCKPCCHICCCQPCCCQPKYKCEYVWKCVPVKCGVFCHKYTYQWCLVPVVKKDDNKKAAEGCKSCEQNAEQKIEKKIETK